MLGFAIKNEKHEADGEEQQEEDEDGDEEYTDLERTSIILDFLVLLCCQDSKIIEVLL